MRALLLAGAMASAGGDVIAAAQRALCAMGPPRRSFAFPARGILPPPGEDVPDSCEPVPVHRWVRTPAGTMDLVVYADGPSGSGRYWMVTVGVAPRRQAAPTRGLCLTTSTVGWRTLQRFKTLPLPWTQDGDQDGRPELVLWDSFALSRDASAAEYGLVAWVYELDSVGTLALDLPLSRQTARELAAAYRTPLEDGQGGLQALRNAAARQLEAFADLTCAPPMQGAR